MSHKQYEKLNINVAYEENFYKRKFISLGYGTMVKEAKIIIYIMISCLSFL